MMTGLDVDLFFNVQGRMANNLEELMQIMMLSHVMNSIFSCFSLDKRTTCRGLIKSPSLSMHVCAELLQRPPGIKTFKIV